MRDPAVIEAIVGVVAVIVGIATWWGLLGMVAG